LKDKDVYPFLDLLTLSTMTLATSGLLGEPHAAPVYFVADRDLRFYFFSDRDSQHARDLDSSPAAAGTIYPEYNGWRDIRGLQMRGKVQIVGQGSEWEAAWSAYCQKFPFVKGLAAVVARNTLYVFTPAWIRMLDNRFGLGFKREWDLEQRPKEA
jgi:uncharacterized protein YhbP (UPF0306 family)